MARLLLLLATSCLDSCGQSALEYGALEMGIYACIFQCYSGTSLGEGCGYIGCVVCWNDRLEVHGCSAIFGSRSIMASTRLAEMCYLLPRSRSSRGTTGLRESSRPALRDLHQRRLSRLEIRRHSKLGKVLWKCCHEASHIDTLDLFTAARETQALKTAVGKHLPGLGTSIKYWHGLDAGFWELYR